MVGPGGRSAVLCVREPGEGNSLKEAFPGDWLVGRRDGSVEVWGGEDFDARFVPHVTPERPAAWSRKTKRAPASAGVTKQKGEL